MPIFNKNAPSALGENFASESPPSQAPRQGTPGTDILPSSTERDPTFRVMNSPGMAIPSPAVPNGPSSQANVEESDAAAPTAPVQAAPLGTRPPNPSPTEESLITLVVEAMESLELLSRALTQVLLNSTTIAQQNTVTPSTIMEKLELQGRALARQNRVISTIMENVEDQELEAHLEERDVVTEVDSSESGSSTETDDFTIAVAESVDQENGNDASNESD